MNSALTQAICWTILHSLWQGLVLTVVAGTVMLFTQKASAAVRYRLLLVLFAAFLVGCGYTFIQEWSSAGATGTVPPPTLSVNNLWQKMGIGHLPTAWIQYCSDHALFIVTGWLIVFSFRCWQMTRSFLYIRRIRKSSFQDPGPYWTSKLHTLSQQLNIQQTVLLLESGVTKIPVVIGHLKPVIYMPLGLLANLPADQVEAVLLHELAHIRRHDFFINLLQNIAEALFFFNPGLLWVSSLLKQEREHCCDDVALQHTARKKQFIEALISFREHAVYGNRYLTAFPGKKNQLLQRVTRIIHNRNNSLNAPEKIFFLSSFLVALVLLVAARHKPIPVDPTGMAKQAPVTIIAELSNPGVAAPLKTITFQQEQYPLLEKPAQRCQKEKPRQQPIMPQEVYETAAPPGIDASQEQVNRQDAEEAKKQAALDRRQAEKDREQAEQDRAQAELDKKQAEKDRAQAEQDRAQAEKDRLQADRDRAQAVIDRKQAEKDRQQAMKDLEQFERDRLAYTQKKTAY